MPCLLFLFGGSSPRGPQNYPVSILPSSLVTERVGDITEITVVSEFSVRFCVQGTLCKHP